MPTEEEQRLYDLVSGYVQSPTLYALPASQRQLITLILRKLLASSTYAISGTLDGLVRRLAAAEEQAASVDAPPDEMTADWEEIDELADEWDEDEEAITPKERLRLTDEQLAELRRERELLREFHDLAKSIVKNSKGEVLLTALRNGFAAAERAQIDQGAATLQQKAVIFTESRRTQEYLFRVLEQTEFAGRVMLFNGTNADQKSREIYQRWLDQHRGTDRISGSMTADKRPGDGVRLHHRGAQRARPRAARRVITIAVAGEEVGVVGGPGDPEGHSRSAAAGPGDEGGREGHSQEYRDAEQV